jgi:hypothetical protein
MKRVLALSLALAAACGGSGSSTKFPNFEGAAWNASVIITANCSAPIGTQTVPRTYSLTFVPSTGADLQFTSTEGCVYKFNVSGNTATLANGPVSCTLNVSNTLMGLVSWTSFTTTTSDGHNLTINTAGSATNGVITCSFTETGAATR